MKNVTVSVPDEVYRQASIRAAERGRSVSALVSDDVRRLSEDHDAGFDRLREMQREVSDEVADFAAQDRLGRDEVHDRAALR